MSKRSNLNDAHCRGWRPGRSTSSVAAIMRELGDSPRALIDDAGATAAKIGDLLDVELTGEAFFFVGEKVAWVLPLPGEAPAGVLILYLQDLGPHPDEDGSRLTGIQPLLVGASEAAMAAFKWVDYDCDMLLRAVDDLALSLLLPKGAIQ